MERRFKACDLEWTTTGGDLYYLIIMREFYANYTTSLENICKKGKRSIDMPNMDRIPVRGIMVDVPDSTINRFLHRADFIPPTTNLDFYSRINDRANQHPWLAQILVEGEHEWVNNQSGRITKIILSHIEKLWQGVL